ncbi:MAG TPA: adenylosuccinate synthase [Herpetosiphonaceae bacterium]|nr:adenylosuccinate synthase [Herpetosiphonaceae bacterium]
MPVVAVIGGQWGDEGKGRIVDLLGQHAQLVVRYSGGNNAGHTVINERGTFKLHLVPAGICRPETINIIGSGVVLDPAVLLDEMATLEGAGVSLDGLFISDRAHVIMPYHLQQDRLLESLRGDGKIGTTGRGIGPAYSDKMERIGIRIGDLLHEDMLRQRFSRVLDHKKRLLSAYGGSVQLSEEIYEQFVEYGRKLRGRIVPIYPLIQEALRRDDRILLEGAQGVLLDVDWGTYPYVTSSSPGAAGACQGAGIGPRDLSHVAGVFKAYATRVGEGPFPTELTDAVGQLLRERGLEFGTVTGRPRRCGWFDAVAARYANRLNSVDQLVITKLDVLDGFEQLRICTGYHLHDAVLDYPPSTARELNQVTPVYETWDGWQQSTAECRSYDALPKAARQYLERIEELIEGRIVLVSVGPERDQVIERAPIF